MNGIVWSEESHPAWNAWRETEKEHFKNSSALPHRWELFKLGWEAASKEIIVTTTEETEFKQTEIKEEETDNG